MYCAIYMPFEIAFLSVILIHLKVDVLLTVLYVSYVSGDKTTNKTNTETNALARNSIYGMNKCTRKKYIPI